MSDHNVPPAISTALRRQAEQQLFTGTAGLSNAFTASADALGVLYRLSSTAQTASDGLKLLHELQTYQVELDIQLEQLQHDEHEHRQELACYQQFFRLAAQPCLIADVNGIITDSNASAAQRLSTQSHSLCGRSVLSLVEVSCQPLLSAALAKAQRSQHSSTLLLSLEHNTTLMPPAHSPWPTLVQLTIQPVDHHALLITLT